MIRTTRWIASTVTAILAAVVLVACGDDGTSSKERNAYAEQVNAAQTTFASTVSSVASGTGTSASVSQQQRTLRRFGRAIDGVVTDLSEIDPPEEVTAEHKRLVAVLENFGNDIREANAAMRNPTPRSISAAKDRVAAATQSVNTRVNAAIAAINARLRKT